MGELARCFRTLMGAHYYQRPFGRHHLLHAIEGVLQHRAPTDDRRELF
jgi:hypothetical protein